MSARFEVRSQNPSPNVGFGVGVGFSLTAEMNEAPGNHREDENGWMSQSKRFRRALMAAWARGWGWTWYHGPLRSLK